jgi:hypothetical protein
MKKDTSKVVVVSESCKICERVPFGKVVPLGFGKWRHDTCEIGTEEWTLYHARLSKEHKRKLADLVSCYKENI